MDSLSTGSMQSWLIVASASLSPMIILFLTGATGRLFRHGKGRASERCPQGWGSVARIEPPLTAKEHS
jgi:hypothetical protein